MLSSLRVKSHAVGKRGVAVRWQRYALVTRKEKLVSGWSNVESRSAVDNKLGATREVESREGRGGERHVRWQIQRGFVRRAVTQPGWSRRPKIERLGDWRENDLACQSGAGGGMERTGKGGPW